MDDNTNNLMNTTMYDALTNAGVKEKDARAAAIEAGKNNLHSMNLEHKLTETHSYVNSSLTESHSRVDRLETSVAELRDEIAKLNSRMEAAISRLETTIAKENQKLVNTVLIGIGVAVTAMTGLLGAFITLIAIFA